MIDRILQAAGFVKDVTYTEAVFSRPPSKTFAVYFDNISADGSDFGCEVLEHSVRIELYALNKPDRTAESRLEAAFKSGGVHFTKTGLSWIESERYYLSVYEFDFIEKE